jgi:hypothetical protein
MVTNRPHSAVTILTGLPSRPAVPNLFSLACPLAANSHKPFVTTTVAVLNAYVVTVNKRSNNGLLSPLLNFFHVHLNVLVRTPGWESLFYTIDGAGFDSWQGHKFSPRPHRRRVLGLSGRCSKLTTRIFLSHAASWRGFSVSRGQLQLL